MDSKSVLLLVLALPLLVVEGGETATIVVNSTLDVISDDGQCTLREAVIASNTDTPSGAMSGECVSGAGKDTIELMGVTYTLTIAGTGENEALTGDLDIRDSAEIVGAGRIATVIDGNDLDRIFHIENYPDIVVSISDMTLRDGATGGSGGAVYNEETLELERVSLKSNSASSDGGAVRNYYGDFSLTDSSVQDNFAGYDGGGIQSSGGLGSIERSVVMSNTAGSDGGGLAHFDTLIVTDSTIAFNTSDSGGGIFSGGTLTLSQSTIASNIASDDGGGIYGYDSMTIGNSTLSGNTAGDVGGGIRTSDSLDIRNSTIFGNSASEGSAVYNWETAFTANTVLSGTCAGTDSLLSLGGNIESPGDSCGLNQGSDQVNVSFQALNLGSLTDNGGPTLTHAPILPSAAIDAGVNGPCLSVDQRGVDRPQDGDGNGTADCDVGSVEVGPAAQVPIFADGFESGDTSVWSSTVP